jgi:hypothetical protein
MYALKTLATVGVVVAAVVFLSWSQGRRFAWRRPVIVAFGLFAGAMALELLNVAVAGVRNPPLWDFKCFWMYGQVAAAHHNVYDPASYQMYHTLLNPTKDVEFDTIGVNVGLPYPPPGVLLVYPLGLVANLSTAMTGWYAVLFSAAIACVFLLWRRFFAADGIAGLVVVCVLVAGLGATHMTLGLTQVDFIALLFLLLFWGEPVSWRAGLWLAPLIFLRPLFILLAISIVVRRQWSALAALAGTGAALIALCFPLLGPGGLATYLRHNPALRYPVEYFIGSSSLYKVLTSLHVNDGSFSLATHPVYLVIAAACVAIATVICALCAQRQRDMCLALLVALGLWLYPATSGHYCVLLLPPMCAVWRQRRALNLSAATVAAFFALNYLLLDVNAGTHTTGLAIALDCVIFGWLAFRRPAARVTFEPPRSRPAPLATSKA